MRISVTKKDITVGMRNACTQCPVALAVLRGAKAQNASVRYGGWGGNGTGLVIIWAKESKDGVLWLRGDASKEVTQFVWDFDHGKKVEPFSFNLVAGYRGFGFDRGLY